MSDIWQAFFCMICFTVVVFIPFATFYYEADSFDLNDMSIKKSRFRPALIQESVVLICFMIILISLYFTKGNIEMPVHEYEYTLDMMETISYTRNPDSSSPYSWISQSVPPSYFNQNVTKSYQLIELPSTFSVYLISFFGWLGWLIFSVFLGVGMTALPFDLICEFIWRPRILPPDVLANTELELQERTKELLEITLLLKRERSGVNDGSSTAKSAMRKRYMTDRLEINKLTQMVYLLERDLENFRACKAVRESYNPLIPYVKLFFGGLFSMLSLIWILQIILAVITQPHVSPFLDMYLLSFDYWFPMFGNLTYAFLSLYLLICTVKGCFKLSVRFVCFKIHPMVVGGTYVNSFLFNLGIVLLCTIPLVNFCVISFSGYTVYTDIYFLLIVEANQVHFYRAFFQGYAFIWIVLITSCATLPLLLYRPRDKATSTEEFRRTLHDRAATTYSPLATK